MTGSARSAPVATASASRLGVAIATTALIVGAAPAAAVARSRLQTTLGPRFATLLLGALALALIAAIAAGLRRAGRPSVGRAARMGAALAVAAIYVAWTGNSDPSIRAVELVHFVEYGLITHLFRRAWQARGGAAAFVLAGLAAFLAGVAEEAYQWWLPARVGELQDVWLNGVAISCALLFISGLAPAPLTRGWPAGATRTVWRLITLTVVALAAFVHLVHLGIAITDGPTSFVSRFTAPALDAAARARAAQWRHAPPLVRPDRLSREDQYATEGLQHVQRRNSAWAEGDAATAWHENRILERWFTPVLDTPSCVSRTGHRWTSDQRGAVEAAAGAAREAPFASQAFPYPLYQWPPLQLWAVALMLAAACLWTGGRGGATA